MRKLARYLKDFKLQLILGPAFKLTEAIFELIVPLVMIKVIDIGVKNQDVPYVWRMGGLMLLLGVIGLACALTCQYFASVASQGTGTVLRNELYAHINTFSHAEIDRFGTHSLTTRLTNDINQLQYAVAMLIRLVIRAPFLAVGAIVMAMTIDLKLSLVILAATPLIILVLYLVMSRSVPFFKKIQGKLDRISLIARENLGGARVIRAFSKQKNEQERFRAASNDLADTSVMVGRLSALLNPLTYAIMNLGIAAILWFGGFQVDGGLLTQGEIIAFINYMTQILLALTVVANLVVTFTKASACAARVNEVFDTKPSIVSAAATEVERRPNAPEILFSNVSFSYQKTSETAIRDIDLSFARGESIGIIGGTGSGKSTLINLIPRFYDATRGYIQVEGTDVRDYPLEQLRSIIGIVPQNASIISGSVADNIRWGKESASEEEIWEALKIAQAEPFVRNLAEGLDTHLEQGGKNLSGGQRQRLTIARAIVGKPRILILDDSFSALDAATDRALRKAISEQEDMTVIMVSQRASSIKSADQIVVMDDGEVVGLGTHQQLLETCQVYREICQSQDQGGER